MRKRIKSIALFILKFAISGVLLWFVFHSTDTESMFRIIRSANLGYLVAALLLFVTSKGVSAYRLNLFFAAIGLRVPQRINLKLYLLGMFYNLFLPGGIGGDAYKAILLKKRGDIGIKEIALATLTDRVTGLIALLIITLMLTWWLPIPLPLLVSSILAVPLILAVSRWIIHRWMPGFRAIFIRTNLQSGAVQLLQVGSAACILLSLNHHDHMLLLLTIFLISSVLAVLPFTFGGAGAREFTFIITGNLLELDETTKSAAIALGLLFYLITALTSLTGMIYLFIPIRFNLKSQPDRP